MKWKKYYQNRDTAPPSILLEHVVSVLNLEEGVALDLGSGTGNDAGFLLANGFKVEAIDKEPDSIENINNKFGDNPNFTSYNLYIEDFKFEKNKYDVINAQFSLFFVPNDKIAKVLKSALDSLKPGGIFCGQLLGVEDEWVNKIDVNSFSEEDIKKVFAGYKFLRFKEIKKEGTTAIGKQKFWHLYNFAVQKNAAV